MKLNKKMIKKFEDNQRDNGTEVAINNLIFDIGWKIFKIIHVKKIRVKYEK